MPRSLFTGSSARQGLAPSVLAERLASALRWGPDVQEVQASGAYLNFRADTVRLTERTLRMVLERGKRYGHADGQGIAACVEHTSANPTGPFHIGRVRNAILGDTLARTLRAAGTPVTTQVLCRRPGPAGGDDHLDLVEAPGRVAPRDPGGRRRPGSARGEGRLAPWTTVSGRQHLPEDAPRSSGRGRRDRATDRGGKPAPPSPGAHPVHPRRDARVARPARHPI